MPDDPELTPRTAAPAGAPAAGRPPAGRGRGGLVRQSGLSSVAAFGAMLSGLLLDVAIATRFGAGRDSDAFFAASRIPIGITALLMSVAIQAWVPLFSRERRAAGVAGLSRYGSRMLSANLLAGLVLAGLATLLAHPLMKLTAPGLSDAQTDLAASMVPPMFLVVPLVAAAEAVRGALNAAYSFVLPAAMNVFMNLVAAAIVLAAARHHIHVVPWAYVIGAAFQLLVIVAAAWRHGLRLTLSWHVTDTRVVAAFKLSARPTASGLLNLANRTAEQAIASFLPSGSITILSYGQRLISALGGGTFFRPVTVALLPRLADAEHERRTAAVRKLVYRALKLILLISLPLTALSAALATPAIRVVFHRGNFTPEDVHLLALTMAIYAASLVGSGVQRVLLAPFYARLDTRTPLRNTVYGVLVDLALLYPCIALFGRHSEHGVLGVALAYSIDQYAIVAHAWWRLRETIGVRGRDLAGFTARTAIAALAGAAAMVAFVQGFELRMVHGRWPLLLMTAVATLLGLAVMAAVGALVAAPDDRERLRRLLRRRRQRRPAGQHRRQGGADPSRSASS